MVYRTNRPFVSVCYFLISKCFLKKIFRFVSRILIKCFLYPKALCLDKQFLGFLGKHSSSADHSCAVCLPDDSLLLNVQLSHETREVSTFHSGVPEMLWSAGGSSALCTLRYSCFSLLRVPWRRLAKRMNTPYLKFLNSWDSLLPSPLLCASMY